METSLVVLIKNFLIGVIGVAFVYLGINQEGVLILAILMAIDFITGVGASRINDKTQVTSARGYEGLQGKLSKRAIPFVVALIGKGVSLDVSILVSLTLGIIIGIEGFSIFGNIYNIVTGKKKPENEALEKLITLLLAWVSNLMNGLLDVIIKSIGGPKK